MYRFETLQEKRKLFDKKKWMGELFFNSNRYFWNVKRIGNVVQEKVVKLGIDEMPNTFLKSLYLVRKSFFCYYF